MRKPPGPINWNAAFGLTWRHAARQWFDPLSFTHEMARYGDLTFYRLFIHRAYQINHPELIHEVLVTKARSFVKERRQTNLLRKFAGDGILTTDGVDWVRHRRILQPAFQPGQLPKLKALVAEETEAFLDGWQERDQVGANQEFVRLSLRVAARALFGSQPDGELAEIEACMGTVSESILAAFTNPFPVPDWMPGTKARQGARAIAKLRDFLDTAIAQRRASSQWGTDLLGCLLRANNSEDESSRLTAEQVRDSAAAMFFAGHHTVAACLTWTTLLLAQHPSVLDRLRQECSTEAYDNEPSLCERVLKESMRMYPPAWVLFARQAREPVELGGYTIARGAWIFIYPWVIHRDERFFPQPDRFDPERFSVEGERRIPKGAYIPFGLGPHACIGTAMANTILSSILPALVRRFDFQLPPEQSPIRPQAVLSLRPSREIFLRITEHARQKARPFGELCGRGVAHAVRPWGRGRNGAGLVHRR